MFKSTHNSVFLARSSASLQGWHSHVCAEHVKCFSWYTYIGLQCFDAVGWAAGRASGLEKTWVVGCWRGYLSGARCRLAQAQLMPLPLTVSCFGKIQIARVIPEKRPLNGCVCDTHINSQINQICKWQLVEHKHISDSESVCHLSYLSAAACCFSLAAAAVSSSFISAGTQYRHRNT